MRYLLTFVLITLLFSCAEVLPPSGGDKDVTPPEIKSTYPHNGALLFVENKIEIIFDEFFKIKTSANDIFISPSLENKPVYKVIGKKLTITFQEELKKNTTYTINFGEAIQDYNEGNILKDFNYIFSTGSYLDSLEINGSVLDSYNKSFTEGVNVLLYSIYEDSVLYKKPIYIAKTNKAGQYKIKNIKAGQYKIAALKDKNQNLIFDQIEEQIAFTEKDIQVTENKEIDPLLLFTNTTDIKILETNNDIENKVEFRFNRPFTEINLDVSSYNEKDIYYYSKDKQSLSYWYLNTTEETEFLFKSDLIDTINLKLKNSITKELFNINIKEEQMKGKNLFKISFPYPIQSFNENNLIIKTTIGEIVTYTSSFSDNKMALLLKTSSNKDSLLLKIDSLCFTSFHNKHNLYSLKWFNNFSEISSNLILTLPSIEDNIILQVLNKKGLIIEEQNVSRETNINFQNIKAGLYHIRIYKDLNNNGIWDSGLFNMKQQAEETLFYSKEIEIKPNWDKELNILLDK